jgi:PhoH-like ATPase
MPTPRKVRKIFVLDTSVLLHDHNCINSFEDNYVAIPITVLEELDKFKIGNDTKNFEARECIRIIDRLSNAHSLQEWIPLEQDSKGKFRILLNLEQQEASATRVFESVKNDHKILSSAIELQRVEGKKSKVILVTKDINLRIKAKALDLPAEDFMTGKVKDSLMLYSGRTTVENIDSEDIRKFYQDGESKKLNVLGKEKMTNHFYVLKNCSSSALAFYSGRQKVLQRVDKAYAYGIKPKNAEQAFAMHAISES